MGMTRSERSVRTGELSGWELLVSWTGVVGAPLIFLIHLEVAYLLVPLACDAGTSLVVHGAAVVAIALAAGTGLLALGTWRRRGAEWPDASASPVSRDLFLGVVGGLLSALVVLAIVAQWIPMFFLSPCRVGA
jgi:hypothetical protein